MRREKFTNKRIEEYAPDPRGPYEVFDTEEKGLFLRISPGGTKSWGLRYRSPGGVHRRLKLGRVPEIKPDRARVLAKAALADVANDGDPAAAKKVRRLGLRQAATVGTVAEVGKRYFDKVTTRPTSGGKRKRLSTIANERDHFDRYILKHLGDQPLRDLSRAQLQRFVDDVAYGADYIEKPSISAARQCRAALSAICRFALVEDLLAESPVRDVTVPAFEARERYLNESEVGSFWAAVSGADSADDLYASRPVRIAIQLALVTLQRRAEIAGVAKSEFDIAASLWVIPRERTKNGRAHAVPLSPMATALIEEALGLSGDSQYLFPSPRSAEDKPIEAQALSHAFRRICAASKLKGVRLHDLRRTGASHMTSERLKIPRFIVSRCLNHTSDTGGASIITAVYDRNDYLAEKRQALSAWADRLAEMIEQNAPTCNGEE